MSALTSSMAPSWSGVSWNGKASSSSRCQTVSGPKAWPLVAMRAEYSRISSAAICLTALRALPLVFFQSAPPSFDSAGRLAADVAGQLVEGVGGDEEPVRRLVPPRRRVLDDQVVALPAVDRAADHLDVAADAVLLVDDEVAGLQLHEVDGVAPAGRHLRRVPHVRAALAGQVVLGEQREPDAGEGEPGLEVALGDVGEPGVRAPRRCRGRGGRRDRPRRTGRRRAAPARARRR